MKRVAIICAMLIGTLIATDTASAFFPFFGFRAGFRRGFRDRVVVVDRGRNQNNDLQTLLLLQQLNQNQLLASQQRNQLQSIGNQNLGLNQQQVQFLLQQQQLNNCNNGINARNLRVITDSNGRVIGLR